MRRKPLIGSITLALVLAVALAILAWPSISFHSAQSIADATDLPGPLRDVPWDGALSYSVRRSFLVPHQYWVFGHCDPAGVDAFCSRAGLRQFETVEDTEERHAVAAGDVPPQWLKVPTGKSHWVAVGQTATASGYVLVLYWPEERALAIRTTQR
jgi:hypothetical protein